MASSLRTMGMVGVSSLLAVSPLSATALATAIHPLWFVAAAVVVLLAAVIGGPLLALSLRDSREPTSEEHDRLTELLAAAEYTPEQILVVETVGENSVQTTLRGLPGRRRLAVSDYALHDLDDETLTALLTAEIERARHAYIEYRGLAATVVIAVATAMFAGLLSFSDGIFGLAVAAIVLFWLGRQLQFAADRAAANRVGPAALADAFAAIADIRGVEPETASWRTYFEVQPPLGQRIERLRARAKRDQY